MRTIAVVGASADRRKFGNKAVRAYVAQGWKVHPINPKGGDVEGLPSVRSLTEIPGGRLDRITLYVPPAVGLALLPEIAASGCDELWLNPGTESDELIAEAERLGIHAVVGCSIVNVGVSPHSLPETAD